MAKQDDEDTSARDSDAGTEEESAEQVSRDSLDELDSSSSELALGEDETGELEELDEDAAPTQLGSRRYVLAGWFVAGIVLTYVLGRALNSFWQYFANRDWFANAVPALAAVSDDDKSSYATVVGAVLAVLYILRSYRKPDIRAWADEVASELSKVKWPTKKDVSNSTVTVLAASSVAIVYLALLDRLWGFVTNLVYGDGS